MRLSLPTEQLMSLSTQNNKIKNSMKLSTRELCIFAMLGALMYASKIIMEFAPNIHLLGMFTMTFTIVYRRKALYPIYIYVLLNGILCGFATWWIPYLYLWAILWGVTMLLPKKLSTKKALILYPLICGLHGLSFGTLYAPAQALLFGLDFKGMIAWIIAGLPWDFVHGIGNLFAGILVYPLSRLLMKLENLLQNNKL